jgi:hypothetical protein
MQKLFDGEFDEKKIDYKERIKFIKTWLGEQNNRKDKKTWNIFMMHSPFWTANEENPNNSAYTALRNELWDYMFDGENPRFDIAIFGHEHDLQRSELLDKKGEPMKDLRKTLKETVKEKVNENDVKIEKEVVKEYDVYPSGKGIVLLICGTGGNPIPADGYENNFKNHKAWEEAINTGSRTRFAKVISKVIGGCELSITEKTFQSEFIGVNEDGVGTVMDKFIIEKAGKRRKSRKFNKFYFK